MTVSQQLTAFATAVGHEIGVLKLNLNNKASNLSALQTTNKANLVAAINELHNAILAHTSISDSTTSTTQTWSSTKITNFIQVKLQEVLNGAPSALDTLGELAAAIANNPNFSTDIVALSRSIRYDILQNLDDTQKLAARDNIDAVSRVDVGNTDTNFVSVFNQGLL